MARVIVELPKETFAAGEPLEIRFGKLPIKRRKAWVVWDHAIVEFLVDLTVAGAALEGEDQFRVMNQVEIYSATGRQLWRVKGDQALQIMYAELGPLTPTIPADIAPGAGTISLKFILPLSVLNHVADRSRDFGIPSAAWKNDGGEMIVRCAALADFTQGSTTVSAIGATKDVRVTLVGHTEKEPQFKVASCWKTKDPENDEDFQLTIKKGLLRYAFLHKRGVNGGASVTGVTDITSEPLDMDNVRLAILKEAYLRSTERHTADLVAADKCVPLFWPEQGQKLTELPYFNGTLPFKQVGSLTGFEVIYNVVEEQDEDTANFQGQKQGVESTKIATTKKTRTGKEEWEGKGTGSPDLRRIMPKKATATRRVAG